MTLKEFREASDLLINHPDHYNQGRIECIEAMESAFGREAVFDFCLLNAFKYIWRCKDKENIKQDLEKARWYILKAEDVYETDTD